MARRLDKAQQEELTAFVNALAAAAGYEVTAEWSRESGYSYPNLTELRAGKGAVDGYNLLRLIRSAAARAGVEPLALAVETAEASTLAGSRGWLVHRLDELAEGVADVLEILRDESQGEHGDGRSRGSNQ